MCAPLNRSTSRHTTESKRLCWMRIASISGNQKPEILPIFGKAEVERYESGFPVSRLQMEYYRIDSGMDVLQLKYAVSP